MKQSDFIRLYPQLFHMAADGAWPSIQARGLLSTRALVDLYDPPPSVREELLGAVRRRSRVLSHAGLPDATVRDQLPLKFLANCLLPGVTEQDFLDALNGRVFFFVDQQRLHRLLGARAYRKQAHTVLTLNTAELLFAHPDAELAPYNTGSVHLPTMPARGPSTFVPLEQYPYEYWRKRRGVNEAVIELTVLDGAYEVSSAVERVERWDGGLPTSLLYQR
jgi:hypothetical protein